jgi:hypothetical protein
MATTNETAQATAQALERLAKQPSPMAQAMAAIPRQPKDRRNAHGGYDYLSEEAVKVACHRAMVSAGIALEGVRLEILSDSMVKAKSGEANMVKIKAILKIGGCHYEGIGAGIDYGDKAMMKAQTAAYREALKLAFVIGTGLDPESDEQSPTLGDPPPARPAPVQKPPEPPPAPVQKAPAPAPAPMPRPAARPAPRPAQPAQPATDPTPALQAAEPTASASISQLLSLKGHMSRIGASPAEMSGLMSSVIGRQCKAAEMTRGEAERFLRSLEGLSTMPADPFASEGI